MTDKELAKYLKETVAAAAAARKLVKARKADRRLTRRQSDKDAAAAAREADDLENALRESIADIADADTVPLEKNSEPEPEAEPEKNSEDQEDSVSAERIASGHARHSSQTPMALTPVSAEDLALTPISAADLAESGLVLAPPLAAPPPGSAPAAVDASSNPAITANGTSLPAAI